MKKGWNKIGKVERPQKSLVIVDGKGNVMARQLNPIKPTTTKKQVKQVKKSPGKTTRKPSRKVVRKKK
jgi:hypothetical protein